MEIDLVYLWVDGSDPEWLGISNYLQIHQVKVLRQMR